jgi:hypothetical protein
MRQRRDITGTGTFLGYVVYKPQGIAFFDDVLDSCQYELTGKQLGTTTVFLTWLNECNHGLSTVKYYWLTELYATGKYQISFEGDFENIS